MVRIAWLAILLGLALAQPGSIPVTTVWLAGVQASAAYPARAGIPYIPAEKLATALGLAYRDSDKIYLALGSRSVTFEKNYSQNDAIRTGGAWKREGSFWVSLPEVARSLGLDLKDNPLAVGLPPATLLGASLTAGQLVLRLDRDVQARLSNNRLQLIGVAQHQITNLALKEQVWGLEVVLPPELSGADLQLSYLPNQVILQRPGNQPPTLLLDAGHGGNDTGLSSGGPAEKTVTLEQVRQLAAALDWPRTELTREDDQGLAVAARARMAAHKAFFVSLHQAPSGPTLIHYFPPNLRPAWVVATQAAGPSSQKLAQTLVQALQRQGIRAEARASAMAVLSQASGAAVLIEVSRTDSPKLIPALAEALRTLLEARP
jgi:N-acetylmuramoyl-L-alanine amidase